MGLPLIMLTSSTPGMLLTLSFFSVLWSFLSSLVAVQRHGEQKGGRGQHRRLGWEGGSARRVVAGRGPCHEHALRKPLCNRHVGATAINSRRGRRKAGGGGGGGHNRGPRLLTGAVDHLLLPPGRPFAADADLRLKLGELQKPFKGKGGERDGSEAGTGRERKPRRGTRGERRAQSRASPGCPGPRTAAAHDQPTRPRERCSPVLPRVGRAARRAARLC